jgi:hypothetical protein
MWCCCKCCSSSKQDSDSEIISFTKGAHWMEVLSPKTKTVNEWITKLPAKSLAIWNIAKYSQLRPSKDGARPADFFVGPECSTRATGVQYSKQAFSYHSKLSICLSQIWSSNWNFCMIVCCCSNDEVYMMRFISVELGSSQNRGENWPHSSAWFSPCKIGRVYHPLVISGLTHVLFTKQIQIQNHPSKKHDFFENLSHNNGRYQRAILSYKGLGGTGPNPRVNSKQSILISCGCIWKLNVSF